MVSFAAFDQSFLIESIKDPRLLEIAQKYGGLCDLICNFVLSRQLLGSSKQSSSYLYEEATEKALSCSKIQRCHLSNQSTFIEQQIFYACSYTPQNILSYHEQKSVVQSDRLNRAVFMKGVEKVKKGQTVKLLICGDLMRMHTILLKKKEDHTFTFLDPDYGEYAGMAFDDLCDVIDQSLHNSETTHLIMIDADRLAYDLQNKSVGQITKDHCVREIIHLVCFVSFFTFFSCMIRRLTPNI